MYNFFFTEHNYFKDVKSLVIWLFFYFILYLSYKYLYLYLYLSCKV